MATEAFPFFFFLRSDVISVCVGLSHPGHGTLYSLVKDSSLTLGW